MASYMYMYMFFFARDIIHDLQIIIYSMYTHTDTYTQTHTHTHSQRQERKWIEKW